MIAFGLSSMRTGALLMLIMLSGATDADLPPEQLKQYEDLWFSGVNEPCLRAIALPSSDNIDEVIRLLASDKYTDRVMAEQALAFIAPFARQRLALLSLNYSDPHVRYVLRRILFQSADRRPESLLCARLVAIRLLRGRHADREKDLIQILSDRFPAVQWAALDELMLLKGADALPAVKEFVNERRDSLAGRPVFLARLYRRLGSINPEEKSSRESLVKFLTGEISHAGGSSEPLHVASALLEALDSCGSRAAVMAGVAKALDDGRLGFSDGRSGLSSFMEDFAAAIAGDIFGDADEKRKSGEMCRWLKDTRRVLETVNALRPEDWSGALRLLLHGARREVLLREQRRIMPFLPANTSFLACFDVDKFRRASLRPDLLKGIHDKPGASVVEGLNLFTGIFGGGDVARVYFAVTDDFPVDAALFSMFVKQGRLDLERLDSLVKQRGLGVMVVTGDFESRELLQALKGTLVPARGAPGAPGAFGFGGRSPQPAVLYRACALGDGAVGIAFSKDALDALATLQKVWKQGAAVVPGELQTLMRASFLEEDECAFAAAIRPGRQLLPLSDPIKILRKTESLKVSLSVGEDARLRIECRMGDEKEAEQCTGAFKYIIEAGRSIRKAFPDNGELARLYEGAVVTAEGKRVIMENKIASEAFTGILRLLLRRVAERPQKPGRAPLKKPSTFSGQRGGQKSEVRSQKSEETGNPPQADDPRPAQKFAERRRRPRFAGFLYFCRSCSRGQP